MIDSDGTCTRAALGGTCGAIFVFRSCLVLRSAETPLCGSLPQSGVSPAAEDDIHADSALGLLLAKPAVEGKAPLPPVTLAPLKCSTRVDKLEGRVRPVVPKISADAPLVARARTRCPCSGQRSGTLQTVSDGCRTPSDSDGRKAAGVPVASANQHCSARRAARDRTRSPCCSRCGAAPRSSTAAFQSTARRRTSTLPPQSEVMQSALPCCTSST